MGPLFRSPDPGSCAPGPARGSVVAGLGAGGLAWGRLEWLPLAAIAGLGAVAGASLGAVASTALRSRPVLTSAPAALSPRPREVAKELAGDCGRLAGHPHAG